MNALRTQHSTRSRLGTSFLGALLALLALVPAVSAEPFRLDRIAVVRFLDIGNNEVRRLTGVFDTAGRLNWHSAVEMSRPGNLQPEIFGRVLVSSAAWTSFGHLGPRALDNFMLTEPENFFRIGNDFYTFVTRNPLAAIATGRLVNLSTRARLGPDGNEIVAGFVIEERLRVVLVRAVGPTLARFGVAGVAQNPVLKIKQNGLTVQMNEVWHTHFEVDQLRMTTAHAGAFPLDEGSLDAAGIITLPPGAYTVHVENAPSAPAGGEVLVEVYSVAEDLFITHSAAEPTGN